MRDSNIIYLYDGTFEGLLTAIFDAFANKVKPLGIYPEHGSQSVLGAIYTSVPTDEAKWRRVQKGIQTRICRDSLNKIYNVFLSEHGDHGMYIYEYLKLGFKMGSNVNSNLADDRVLNVVNLSRRVGNEIHKFYGFVRFRDIGGDILYSEIEPTYNIISALMPYFCDRMPSQRFIIADLKRNIYGIYNTEQVIFTDSIPGVIGAASARREQYEHLWKRFFDTIAIKERESRRRQMNFMPKKYWKHIVEKN